MTISLTDPVPGKKYTPFFITLGPGPLSATILKLGNLDEVGAGRMQFDVPICSKYTGRADMTQLMNGEYGGIWPVGKSTGGDFWLDNVEFYLGGSDAAVVVWANLPLSSVLTHLDAPQAACCFDPTWFAINFKCYVRFRPDNGNPSDNIYVVLGTTSWGVDASATKVHGAWVKSRQVITGPEDVDDSDEFPFWKYTFQ
jgi:hypothetical protein